MTPRCPTAVVAAMLFASAAFAQTTFLGPTPYASKADSPFDLSQLGYTHLLEDFEDGTLDLPGVIFVAGGVKGPSPTTDSVDEDDGAIDGVGTGGHCWHVDNNTVLFIEFIASELGGLPTEVGFAWTDGGPMAGVTIVALGPNGTFLGQFLPLLGDEFDGTVGDDRFLGIKNPAGISAMTVTNVLGELEIDHMQVKLPVPRQAAFMPIKPYHSTADSPFTIVSPGVDHGLVDFESGDMLAYGATVNANFLIPPSSATDSVDFDDGLVDNDGAGGSSVAQVQGVPLVVTFDPTRLGGLPTKFGAVVTDVSPGPRKVRVKAFGAGNAVLGTQTYVVIGDDNGNSATDEDRFVGFDSLVGVTKVEITPIDTNMELDHIQYDIPTPPTGLVDPTPYASIADSPFNIVEAGRDHEVVDFEDGTAEAYGATVDVQFIIGPSSGTDSVDADDGVIDGNGNGGWSAAQLEGTPIEVTFDAEVLGGLPLEFGAVVTDLAVGQHTVLLRLFDEQDALVLTRTYTLSGDPSFDGTTIDDRFIGATSTVGIARATITPLNTNIEIDHIQWDIAVPSQLTFLAASAYLGVADSPFDIQDPGTDFEVVDFEEGTVAPTGASLTINFVIAPSVVTDSVDEDDGAIDGNGNGGWSGAEVQGIPIVVEFDSKALRGLPTMFGIVITDMNTGPSRVTLRGFDDQDGMLGTKTFVIDGDEESNGTTAEDRFIGFVSDVGLARVEIVGLDANIEVDHIQYDLPVAPPPDEPADLNDDGIVDGADLALVLANWGGAGLGDINGDGTVDGADLAEVLAAWTGM